MAVVAPVGAAPVVEVEAVVAPVVAAPVTAVVGAVVGAVGAVVGAVEVPIIKFPSWRVVLLAPGQRVKARPPKAYFPLTPDFIALKLKESDRS